jgi:hypothetical protein
MNKENMAHVHIEILLSHKKNEILSFSTTQMEVEIIIQMK